MLVLFLIRMVHVHYTYITLYIIHTTKYVLHMNSKHDVCTGKTDFISLFRYMYIHSVTRSAKANMFTLSPSRKTA